MPTTTDKSKTLHVLVTREMFSETFTLALDNGQTEELEPEEIRHWFKIRGANMDKMEKALDQAFNFQRCEVEIENFREPPSSRLPHSPNI